MFFVLVVVWIMCILVCFGVVCFLFFWWILCGVCSLYYVYIGSVYGLLGLKLCGRW